MIEYKRKVTGKSEWQKRQFTEKNKNAKQEYETN